MRCELSQKGKVHKQPADHTHAHARKEHRKFRFLIFIDSLSAVSDRELIRWSWFPLIIDKASRISTAVTRAFALAGSLFVPLKADAERARGVRACMGLACWPP